MVTFTFSTSNLKRKCCKSGCGQSAIVLYFDDRAMLWGEYYCQKHAPSLEDAISKTVAARTKGDAVQS